MTLTKISLHCNLNPITPTVYKGFKHTLKIVAANIRVCLTILWIIRRSVINDFRDTIIRKYTPNFYL